MAKKIKADEVSTLTVNPAAPQPDAFGPAATTPPNAATPAAATPPTPTGDLEADADQGAAATSPADPTPPTLTEPAAPRTPEEIRAADPFQLTAEEIERDLAPLVDLDAQRQEASDVYAAAIKAREDALRSLTAQVNAALDAKRRFEDRYAELGERRRLLLAAKKKLTDDAERAAEQAKKDAEHNAELARQKGVRELQAKKDQMTEPELARHREDRQRELAQSRQVAAAS